MLPARLDKRDCCGSEGRQTVAVNPVNLTVETMPQRVRSEDQLAALFDGGWPPFIDADTVAAQHLPRVRQLFADLEVVLVDRGGGDLVASAWGVPLRWDGTTEGLPNGYSDSLTRALRDHDTDRPTGTLVICAAQGALRRSRCPGRRATGPRAHRGGDQIRAGTGHRTAAADRKTPVPADPHQRLCELETARRFTVGSLAADPPAVGCPGHRYRAGFTGVHRIGAPMGRLDRPQLAGQRPVPGPGSVGSATTGPTVVKPAAAMSSRCSARTRQPRAALRPSKTPARFIPRPGASATSLHADPTATSSPHRTGPPVERSLRSDNTGTDPLADPQSVRS